ncbi:MAG: hypothetical protein KAQ93_00495 [Spirochaetales bacterium]|nr:hypothetical protein [Spirochaetales bacterium]
MLKKILIIFSLLMICFSFVFGQEVSEKKEIAIFSLSYTDWSIPDGALGLVDQSIQNVFVNLKRFDIIGMSYRLNSGDITSFIEEIQKVKEANIEVPEAVRLGEQTFTEADFNKLVGAFIIVVPVMSYYEVLPDDNGGYSAEIQTSFTFINVAEGKAFANFQVDTTGSNDTAKGAVKSAVDSMPIQLSFEVRKIPEFQLKTGILDVNGKEILIELGANMGIKLGDEFNITNSVILPSGHVVEKKVGLLVIKEVNQEVSTAQVFYARKKPAVGDQLKEIPRMGFESAMYINYISQTDSTANPILAIGIRQIAARGFYKTRPYAGVEIPLGADMEGGFTNFFFFPVNVFVGTELNWFLGRLHITPAIDVSLGMLVPIIEEYQDDYVIYSSIGGHVRLGVSYMISDNIKIFGEAGYAAMLSINEGFFNSYSGILYGGGVTFKY